MLALSEKPTWWEEEYGPAPYTCNNQNLWFDLEHGVIRHGERKGIDAKYIRTGLSKLIPVDDQGNLLPPTSTIVSKYNANKVNESFSFGDHGPVETAWRRSSEYPFALQQALALMKPAFYFGTLFDTNGYIKTSSNEYLLGQTNQRVSPKYISLNGDIVNGELVRTSGYINYILDYINNLGIDAVNTVKDILDNVTVQLSYKMSGFTDKNYLFKLFNSTEMTNLFASRCRSYFIKFIKQKLLNFDFIIDMPPNSSDSLHAQQALIQEYKSFIKCFLFKFAQKEKETLNLAKSFTCNSEGCFLNVQEKKFQST
jgi:hypothetical protein